MLNVKSYNIDDDIEDGRLKFAVIAAQYKDKWIFVRHKDRTTWEIPGGHREEGEDIEKTASRELFEETGVKDFNLYPVCTYSVEQGGEESFGKLYYAEVNSLGDLPRSEIAEVRLLSEMPYNLTYPGVQPFLLKRTIEFLANGKMQIKDIKLSEMLELSYRLWEKHKDTWSPMEPEYGRNFILYMIEEIGEVIAIIKKKGEDKITDNMEIRANFIEELGDVLMYFVDVLNRFNITAEEFSTIYMKKFNKNMERDYKSQYEDL